MKKYFASVVVFCLTLLTACTEAPKPPACRDEASLALMTKIINKNFQEENKNLGTSEITMSFTITNVIANNYDPIAKRWSCSASVTGQVPRKTLDAVNDLMTLGKQSGGVALMAATGFLSFKAQYVEQLPNISMRDYRHLAEDEFTRQMSYATQFDAQDQKSLVVELVHIDDNIPLRLYSTVAAVTIEFEKQKAKELKGTKANLANPDTTNTMPPASTGLVVKVRETQMCGEESLCVKTDQGEWRTNINTLNDLQTNLLKEATQQKSLLILKGADRANMTFESIEKVTN